MESQSAIHLKIILAFYLLFTMSSSAQLGEGRSQVQNRYGNKLNPHRLSLISNYFKEAHIEVRFDSGGVSAITYQIREDPKRSYKPVQMTLAQLKRFLSHNTEAGAWEKTGERTWIHKKEKKRAFYSNDEHRLYVWGHLSGSDNRWDRTVEYWKKFGYSFSDEELASYRRIQSIVCKEFE